MVKLNVFERLMAMGLLPKEGSYVTLRIQRELTTKLGMSEEELKEFDIRRLEMERCHGTPRGWKRRRLPSARSRRT